MNPLLFALALASPSVSSPADTEHAYFVGKFSTSYLTQRVISLSTEGGTLILQMNQREKVKLVEKSPFHFQLEGIPMEIEFQDNGDKPVESFVLHRQGRKITFQRVEKLQKEYQAIAKTPRPNGLSDAVLMNDLPAAKALIEKGADVMEMDTRGQIAGRNGRRPLNWAALEDNVVMLELLLKNGADINATNLSGFTPLHHAAEAGAIEAATFLLKMGADKTLQTKNHRTALEIAAISDNRKLVSVLEAP